MILVCLFSDGIFFLNFATKFRAREQLVTWLPLILATLDIAAPVHTLTAQKSNAHPFQEFHASLSRGGSLVQEFQVFQVYHTSLSRGGSLFQCFRCFTGVCSRSMARPCRPRPWDAKGRNKLGPNRRQVKPAPPEASKRREVLGRSERPAMERLAAWIIASPIRRTACVNDKRPQKPCASTTV